MDPDDWPDWLPAGWTMQIRKIDERKVKCYMDPEGRKFYSKPQVDRHLKSLNNITVSEKTNNGDGSTVDLSLEPDVPHTSEGPQSTPRPRGRPRKPTTVSSSNKSKETGGSLAGDGSSSGLGSSQRKNGESDWLPDGWTVEVKTKAGGAKYKIYMDPVSGRKFFSKPQVLSYLGTTNSSGAKQREGEKFSAEPDKPQKYEATGGESNDTPKKIESARMSISDYELISSTPAEGLPPGWMKEIRMRKHGKKDPYYLDPLSGYIFFSKLDALRYLESGDVKKCAIRPLRRDMNEGDHNANVAGGEFASPPQRSKRTETSKVSPNNSATESKTKESGTADKRKVRSITGDGYTPDASRKNEVSEWLPDGWDVEVIVRDNGSKYKCFKESATGRKFYSKPQVLSYLGNVNSSNSRKRKGSRSYSEDGAWSRSSGPSEVKRQKGSIKKKGSILNSDYTEVITTSPAEGLPPGWIKEIRTKKYATHERKDPYYTDPLTGYIFRSKLDALRFLETGDVELCAIRPKKKDANGNEVYVFGPDGQKRVKTPRKQLVEDKQQNDASTDPTTQILEENHVVDPETAAATSASGRGTRVTPARNAKRNKPSTALTARTSGRLKAVKPETKSTDPSSNTNPTPLAPQGVDNGVVQEKQTDEDQLSYQLEEDPNWTDQCLDFAVRTLTSEILTGDMPVNVQNENARLDPGTNETPAKVN